MQITLGWLPSMFAGMQRTYEKQKPIPSERDIPIFVKCPICNGEMNLNELKVYICSCGREESEEHFYYSNKKL